MGKRGFTLIEILVVIAIIGILSATAVPAYNFYRQRSTGAEASVIVKNLLEHEIMYFLENDEYFPAPGDILEVYKDGTTLHNGAPSATVIQDITDALNVEISVRHNLDFQIRNFPDNTLQIWIIAPFAIFKTFPNDRIGAQMDKSGKITWL